jgi:tRNA nucleotidyltransferase (CCA-adding enzyme)
MIQFSSISVPGACYLVGGAVRDHLLQLPVKDRDWVVVGATPEQMLAAGFRQVGADFPVFLHPDTGEEYALARTERKSGRGYKGFECHSSPDVTLEQDLSRRDLTINAMAMDHQGRIVDPYGGQQDLTRRLLRHVSSAFSEDPLRILRVARFAARFHPLGFGIAPKTLRLMRQMVRAGEVACLTPERIWQETVRCLDEKSPWIYIQVLRECGALAVIMPELDALFGIPQPPAHHPEIDSGLHTLMVLEQACRLSDDSEVRFAALLHDLGKALTPRSNWPHHYQHETLGLAPIRQLCGRLRVPNGHRELALLASEFHLHVHRSDEFRSSTIQKLFAQTDAYRRPERFEKLLRVCEADARGRTGCEDRDYPQPERLRAALRAAAAVEVKALLAQGLTGKALGEAITRERVRQIKALRGGR